MGNNYSGTVVIESVFDNLSRIYRGLIYGTVEKFFKLKKMIMQKKASESFVTKLGIKKQASFLFSSDA